MTLSLFILSLLLTALTVFRVLKIKSNSTVKLIVIGIVFIIQAFWCALFSINTSTYSDKITSGLYYEHCGKVTERIDGFERHGKHHNEYYKEYLVVKYDDGTYDRVDVSRDTYERHSVNSRICFIEKKSICHWYEIAILLGGGFSFIGVIIYVFYIFNIKLE